MRFGIISDVHSNIEAFTVALSLLSERDIDEIICLGDLVGYGASPNECVALARERIDKCIMGNHDSGVVGQTDISYFSEYAAKALIWTVKAMQPENLKFLERLPIRLDFELFCAVHSTPGNPKKWEYIFTSADAMEQFKFFDQWICFVGHSHIPAVFTQSGKAIIPVVPFDKESITIKLHKEERYIINVGSVGQPRDNDPRGCAVIFDSDENTLTFMRFEYLVSVAQNKILKSGLPQFLAQRLALGI